MQDIRIIRFKVPRAVAFSRTIAFRKLSIYSHATINNQQPK